MMAGSHPEPAHWVGMSERCSPDLMGWFRRSRNKAALRKAAQEVRDVCDEYASFQIQQLLPAATTMQLEVLNHEPGVLRLGRFFVTDDSGAVIASSDDDDDDSRGVAGLFQQYLSQMVDVEPFLSFQESIFRFDVAAIARFFGFDRLETDPQGPEDEQGQILTELVAAQARFARAREL